MTSDFADALETLELAVETLQEMQTAQHDGLKRSRDWWINRRMRVQWAVEQAQSEVLGLALVYDREVHTDERVPAANSPAA